MATKFLGTDAWKRIKVLNRRRGRRFVAVPYLSENASKRLTLSSGDLLVVRLDMASVKTGQTSPKDVLAYIKKGVEVHKLADLHAKVFVFGDTAVIGSTNVSATSEGTLLEAAVETTATSVVGSAKAFVRSLRGDVVTPQEAERLQKFYRRPKFPQAVPRKRATATLRGSGQSKIWAVPLVIGLWKDEDWAASVRETPKARRQIRNTKYFTVDDFLWVGAKFAHKVKLGDRVLQITRVEDGRKMVTAPGRVVRKHVFGSDGKRRTLIFLELRKNQRRKTAETVCSRLGALGLQIKNCRGPKQLKDPALLYEIGRLWGGGNSG